MEKSEAITAAQTELMGLADSLGSDQLDRAADRASAETGWSYPVSGSFRESWVVERLKRWAISFLRDESASKFKYKQVNLQQRFEHYDKLVRYMDEEFKQAVEDNPAEFASLDPHYAFGTKIDAGFSYDSFGRETTYSDENLVGFGPTEE